jgi:hypothetical protein
MSCFMLFVGDMISLDMPEAVGLLSVVEQNGVIGCVGGYSPSISSSPDWTQLWRRSFSESTKSL